MAPPLVASDRKALQAWFDTWDGPISYEMQQLRIEASEKVAFVHALVRISGRRTDGSSTRTLVPLDPRPLASRVGLESCPRAPIHPFYMDGSLSAAVDLAPV